MIKKRHKYYYFFAAALLLQLFALLNILMDPPQVLEFTLYNVDYTIGEVALLEYLMLFYLGLGVGYWLIRRLRRKPNRTLSNIHTIVTVGSLVLYLCVIPFNNFFEEDRYIEYSHNKPLIMILLPLVVIAQLLYMINIIIAIRTPYRSHRHKNKKKEY